MRRIASNGSKIGGKWSLKTMMRAPRVARAYKAGKARKKIDPAKVRSCARRARQAGR